MSAFLLVVVVIAVFFVTGIAVGVLIVIALPAIRRHRARRIEQGSNGQRYVRPTGRGEGGVRPPGQEDLPPTDGDEKPSRWPGG